MRTQASQAGVGADQVAWMTEGQSLRLLARLEDWSAGALVAGAFPAANAWDLQLYEDGELVYELYGNTNVSSGSGNTILGLIATTPSVTGWNVDGVGFTFADTFTVGRYVMLVGRRYELRYVFHSTSYGDIKWSVWVEPVSG